MTDLLKILVDTGDSSRQVDDLTRAFNNLDRKIANYASDAPKALAQVEKALANTSGVKGKFLQAQEESLKALASGEGAATEANFVRRQNSALAKLYESRLATAGLLTSEELAIFRKHGVALGGLQKAQLADDAAALKVREAALKADLAGYQHMLAVKLAAEQRTATEIAKAKQVSEAANQAALKADLAGYQHMLAVKLAAEQRTATEIAKAKQVSEAANQAALKADLAGYQHMLAVKLAAEQRTATEIAKARALATKVGIPQAQVGGAFAPYDAQARVRAAVEGEFKIQRAVQAARDKANAANQAALKADLAGYHHMLQLKVAAERRAAIEIAKAKASGSNLGVAGSSQVYNTRNTENLTTANRALSGSFKQLAVDGNDVHSMARGLASSFGLLWLTWGNLIPLFAGAAISASVKNVVTLGAEVQHTMETIRVLSQETEAAVAGLNEQLLVMARSGPFGPQEVANAMKTLSLAGLSAGEVSASVQDVLNFAVAGTTDLKTAADVMTSVATAFGVTAHGYNYVGDVISKTAAVSKSSVESIGEAFKTASVIHKQYGASLEDVGVGLAALSNLGIQGSAAGTALRNMYVDLSGRTPKVTKAMQELGLELKDQNGRFVDLITMTERTAKALGDLEGKGRAKALSTILSERGGKPVIELLDLAEKRAKNFSTTIQTELQRMRSEIGNSAGFMAQAAVQLALTPESQLKSIKASLQATLVETFAGMEPEILAFSRDLKNLFNSPEFKDGLKTLATGALDFGRALAIVTSTVVEHSKTVLALVSSYYLARLGVIAYTGYQQKLVATTVASTAATVAETAATRANQAAKMGALAGLARFLPGVGTAVTVAGLSWAAYEAYLNSAKRAEAGYVDSGYGASIIQRLQEETKRIQELNRAKALGLSLDELKAREASSDGKLESTAARVSAERELRNAETAYASATKDGRKLVQATAKLELDAATAKLESAKEVERIQKREVSRASEGLVAATKVQKLLNQPTRPDITGTGKFDQPTGGFGSSSTSTRATLDEIIKREREQAEALKVTGIATTEFDKVNVELAKNLKGLDESYKNILKNYPSLDAAKKKELEDQRTTAENLIRQNALTQTKQALAKQEYDDTIKRVEATYREIRATDELINARYKATQESQRQIGVADDKYNFEQSIKYQIPAVQAIEKSKYEVRASYIEKLRQLELEHNKRIAEMTYTEEGEFKPNVNIQPELDSFNRARSAMLSEGLTQEAKASAQAYQQAWDQTTSTIASNFTSKLMNGTLDLKEFMIETFASMVLQPQLQIGVQQAASSILGGSGGWFSSMLGMGAAYATGGTSAMLPALAENWLDFEGGGFTGTGPRSGGLDGKGGFMAMVHPNETIIDHTKGGGSEASSAPVYITIHNTVGDVATKSMLDQANAATVKQIQAGMARSARYNGAMAR